ncbi:MAG: fumarylacetoacetate hydrolase family protein [Dongiaceae bacterium]
MVNGTSLSGESKPYRLLTYGAMESARAGLLIDDSVYDAARITGVSAWCSVMAVLAEWDRARIAFAEVVSQMSSTAARLDGYRLDDLELQAPVLYPGSIFCAGSNYADHLAEMAKAAGRAPGPNMRDLGEMPWHFLKTSRSSVVGDGAKIPLPAGAQCVDWEIELVAVIGKVAKDVPMDDALSYVAGYTIANDLSARDLMKRAKNAPASPFYFDWIGHKCFDGSCPLGPWIVPASEIPEPGNLGLKLWVGDELMQDSNTNQMIFSVAEQIAALSSRVSLHPGDVVLTGTPAGVGNGRQRFLQRGEQVRMWIENIGELTHTMV